jgi:YD repeat-containing protein
MRAGALIVVAAMWVAACASSPQATAPVAAVAPAAPAAPAEAAALAEEANPAAVEAPVPAKVRVGLLVGRVRTLTDGSVDRKTVYVLDDAGLVLREETRNGAGGIQEIVTYTYAGAKVAAKLTLDAHEKLVSSRGYGYGAAGLVAETLLDARGAQQTRSAYAYDASGRLATWSIFDGKDAPIGTVVYRYDGERRTEAEVRGPTGEVDGYTSYAYDADGRVISEKTLSSNRSVERSVERRYAAGALVEEQYLTAGGAVDRSVSYESDDLGNPLRITTRDGKGRVLSVQALEYRYVER